MQSYYSSNDPGLEERRLRKPVLAHLSKGFYWWLLFCPCSQVVGSPPWLRCPSLPYCDLPTETCRLARPAPLHFIGIWRLLCTARGNVFWMRSNCLHPPEKQVLSQIGGDNLLVCCSVHSPEQRQFLWKVENENSVRLARNSQGVNERRFESSWRVMPELQGLEPARVFRAHAIPTQVDTFPIKKKVCNSGCGA